MYALALPPDTNNDDYPEEATLLYEAIDSKKLAGLLDYTISSIENIVSNLNDWFNSDAVDFYSKHGHRIYVDKQLPPEYTDNIKEISFSTSHTSNYHEATRKHVHILTGHLDRVRAISKLNISDLIGVNIPLSIRSEKETYNVGNGKFRPFKVTEYRYHVRKDPQRLIGVRVAHCEQCDKCGILYEVQYMKSHQATIECHLRSVVPDETQYGVINTKHHIHAVGISKLSNLLIKVPSRYTYMVPKWVEDAILLHKTQYADSMELHEFLDKVCQDGNADS